MVSGPQRLPAWDAPGTAPAVPRTRGWASFRPEASRWMRAKVDPCDWGERGTHVCSRGGGIHGEGRSPLSNFLPSVSISLTSNKSSRRNTIAAPPPLNSPPPYQSPAPPPSLDSAPSCCLSPKGSRVSRGMDHESGPGGSLARVFLERRCCCSREAFLRRGTAGRGTAE